MSHGANCLIELDSVRVAYSQGNGQEKVVLDDVRLRIREGEFVTLVGPSGGGKSTIMKLILGSQFPTAGTVRVDGKEVQRVERERGIVYQNYSLFPNLTVVDNIAVGSVIERISMLQRVLHTPGYFRAWRQARAEARRMLEQIRLTPADFDKYPQELSGGMRQRVAIAQAVIVRPRVLLMDEPFGALDQTTREGMQVFALEVWQQFGTTVVFVTHDLEEALYLGTRVIGLSQYDPVGDASRTGGAKVLVDQEVPGGLSRPAGWKSTPEFQALVQTLLGIMKPTSNAEAARPQRAPESHRRQPFTPRVSAR